MAHALFLARAALAATLLSSAALSSAGELAVYRFTDTLQSADTDPLSVAGNFSLHVRPPLTGNAAFSTIGADRVARFGFVSMPPTTPSPLARALANNFFSSFTVTPDQDQALNLDSLDFRLSNNVVATTPNLAGYAVYSSVDNFTDALLGPLDAPTTLSAVPTIDLSVAAYQGLLAPVTFRIYHWSISQAGSLLVGGFLDDVVLRGSTVNVASVTPVPEPSAHLLLLAGLAALAWRRHRTPPAEPGAKA